MRVFILSALIVAATIAAALVVSPAAGLSQPAREAPPAWQLLQQSERSVVRVADAARLSAVGLRAGSPLYTPFWDALEEMDRALIEVRSSMGGRNQRYFRALRGGSRALAQLRVVWSRTGVYEPAVSRALDSLGSSYRPLRAHYGPEQARAERGGELTPQERQRFREIQRMQARLIAVLQPLRAQAASRGDREMTTQVDRLLERAEDIASADLTLDEYLDASLSEDELMGEWDGNGPYVEPSYRSAWHAADAAVEELYVAEEAGFVFSIDLGSPGGKTAGGIVTGLPGEPEPAGPVTEQPAAGEPGVTVYGSGVEDLEVSGDLFDDPLFADDEEAEPVEVVEEPALAEAADDEGAGEAVEEKAAAEPAPAAEATPEEAAENADDEPAPETAAPISEEDIPAADLPVAKSEGEAGDAAPKTTAPETPPIKPPLGAASLAAVLPL